MGWRRVICVIALGFGSALAHAEGAIADVATRIAHPSLLRGHFVQLKQVAGFRKPLRSAGQFVLVRERGIIWRNEQPFASSLVVTPERLVSEVGGSTRRVDAAQEPAVRAINAILFDLIDADIARLQARFDLLAIAQADGRWQLKLTPKAGTLTQAINAVELEGARHVDRVVLVEANGDRSEIAFSELAESPALTPEEAARLAQ